MNQISPPGKKARWRRPHNGRSAVSLNVILAAKRRGWTNEQIALACGISHQAISDRLVRRNIKLRVKTHRHHDGRIFWKCRVCGKGHWSNPNEVQQFCSHKCNGEFVRVLSDEAISKAIELRYNGNSWQAISRIFNRPFQTIQRAIWLLLHKRGKLTINIVHGIWRPVNADWRSHASWHWLENRSGWFPLPDSATTNEKEAS